MSYDAMELEPKDVIRGWAGDTSNDVESEIAPDATYVAVLTRYGAATAPGSATDTAPFYRAAIDILQRVASAVEREPTSISAPGDGSIGWTAFKSKALLEKIADLKKRLEAAEESEDQDDGWGVVTVTNNFLTGGVETW